MCICCWYSSYSDKDAVPSAKTADGILAVSNSGNRSDRTGGILTVTVPSALKSLEDVSLGTSNGNICIGPNDTITVKNLTLTSENGDLIVDLDDSIKNYTISPSTTSGDIIIGDTSYSTTNGAENQITIGSGQKVLKIWTQSGDIEIDN